MIDDLVAALPPHAHLLVLLGAAAGFLAGLIGIGGGFVLVPGLLALLGSGAGSSANLMPTVLGTTMACMIFTAAAAAWGCARRGSIDYPAFGRMAPFMAAGAALGAMLAGAFPGHLVKAAFGAFCIYSATRMLGLVRPPVAVAGLSIRDGRTGLQSTAFGVLCGFIGVGGANLVVPFLLKRGLEMRPVVGTASALQVPMAMSATVSYIVLGGARVLADGSLGHVRLPVVALLVLGSIVSAPLGVVVSHRLPVPVLKRVFGLFTGLVGVKMLWPTGL